LTGLKLTCNTVHFVGHGTVRIAAMGFEEREPSPRELEEMKAMVDEAMRAGAIGISTGLIYPPAVFSKTEELIELTKVVAKYGGVYFSHIRGEAETLIEAMNEAIRIGEETGAPVHISHHKASGRAAWGKIKETLHLIELARNRGVDVSYDQYPYTAGMTSLVSLLPSWVHEGGMDKMLERLRDESVWTRVRSELDSGKGLLAGVGWQNVIVSSVRSESLKRIEGKNLSEIARLLGKPDEATALRDILLQEKGEVTMIVFSMDESDVEYAMRGRYQMVGTDSWSVCLTGPTSLGKPHPRFYGTYPRILAKYVREKGILTLEDAVRRMTSFPAQRIGLQDRGQLREGFYADIVIFDPETINDRATYEEPAQLPEGISTVLVNGGVVVDSGKLTDARPGRILRRVD
jgi:N-acyl-D-amino-acid deacylase